MFSAAAPAHPADTCLHEPAFDSILLSALDRVYRADYRAADSLLRAVPEASPARAYFSGLVSFNRFNDLGDTAALSAAAVLWDSIRARAEADPDHFRDGAPGLYAGLSDLQSSYVASITGHSIRSATLGRRAAAKLKPLQGYAEADAALALYDYYKAALLKGLSWIPFVKPDLGGPLRRMETSVPRSRYLHEVLQTSLLWLYYDGGRYDQGLVLIDAFLARYPGNRLGRQIKGDFLFRKRDYAGARLIQEELFREFSDLRRTEPCRTCLPLGYLSAAGNLAKVYSSLNQGELLKKHLAVWSAPEFREVLPWLPGSLRREVKDLGK